MHSESRLSTTAKANSSRTTAFLFSALGGTANQRQRQINAACGFAAL